MKTENKDNKKVKNKTQQVETPGKVSAIKAFFKNETVHFIFGLAIALIAAFALVSFGSFFLYGAADQSVIDNSTSEELLAGEGDVQNMGAIRGAQLADYFINHQFGAPSIFMVIFLLVMGLKLMRVVKVRLWKWFIGCSLLMVWCSVFFGFMFKGMYEDTFFYLGGLHGYNVSSWLESQVGVPGVLMILFFTAVCLLAYLSTQTIIWLRKLLGFGYLKRKKKETPAEDSVDMQTDGEQQEEAPVNDLDDILDTPKSAAINLGGPDDNFIVNPVTELLHGDDEEVFDDGSDDEPYKKRDEESEPGFEVDVPEDEEVVELEPYNPRLDLSHYKFPTLDLMKHFDNDGPSVDMEEQQDNKNRIVEVLHSFGIEIKTITATVGPTITLYEITLAEGIRIAKIRSLEDDIALQLAALGIRIIAPIPGKGTIGIEVPNKTPRVVSGQSVIGSKAFQESKADLPVVL